MITPDLHLKLSRRIWLASLEPLVWMDGLPWNARLLQHQQSFRQPCRIIALIGKAWGEHLVQHAKVSNVLKAAKVQCDALSDNRWRPIAVLPCFWRAWSSTWLRSSANDWAKDLFGPYIPAGLPGSIGAEALAAVLDYKLHQLRY